MGDLEKNNSQTSFEDALERTFTVKSIGVLAINETIDGRTYGLDTKAESLTDDEKNLVTWDGPDDPLNPMNTSDRKKFFLILLISLNTFITPLASSMFAPGVKAMDKEFDNDNALLSTMVISIYVLGFAIGPLFIAPLSELYGRQIIYRLSTILFTVFTIGCGECQNFASLMILRMICGLLGATPLALGNGSVADLIPIEKRGRYMAMYVMGPVAGPSIGPLVGGFLAAINWRWIFRLLAIASGVLSVATWVFLEETYAPRILQKKAIRLRKETGNQNLMTAYERQNAHQPPLTQFIRAIVRPCKLLILSPIVTILSLYAAVNYGTFYLLLTTYPSVFEKQYGFGTNTVGLSYLGLGIGSLLCLALMILYSDRLYLKLVDMSESKERKPEYRLVFMIIYTPLVPIGLILYGWSVQKQYHWMVAEVGSFICGLGILGAFLPVMSYLVDAYSIYAASAASASTVVRSLGGAFLPLAESPLYENLNYGWGNTLLAFVILACYPVPLILYYKGESLRKKFTPALI
ncbi:major facilitator superfamily domain-containing protein [Dipodascopsis tothii]|uniref:major facilitator superfamily domain-containing protein n=1 Tax=Dipodascopsis tothii TaxID=44089 RepID=UPI0034CF083E